MNGTSNSLQQSLMDSIRESRNRSVQNSLMSESSLSQNLSVSKTFDRQEAFIKTNNYDYNSQWISFCQQIQSQFSHYLFEIQTSLNNMKIQLASKDIVGLRNLLEESWGLISPLNKAVIQDHMYIYSAFINQYRDFASQVNKYRIKIGITDAVAKISDFEHVELEENFHNLQETFSMFSMTHLFQQKIEVEFEDEEFNFEGSSISSDFSDENNEIEDFENNTAEDLMKQIKTHLIDPDIYDACKQFHFGLYDGQMDLKEFFRQTLKFNYINDYEIICFLLNSGIFLKTFKTKAKSLSDQLTQFIVNLQQVLNRILTSNGDQISAFARSNHFGFECMSITKREYFSRKNILKQQFQDILQAKLKKWKDLNLTYSDLVENFTEEIQRSYDKKYLRKLCQKWNIPVNKFEVKLISWEKGAPLLDLIQRPVFTYNSDQEIQNVYRASYQGLIIKLVPVMEDFMTYFSEQDISQTGYVDFRQFFSAIKQAAIPISPRDTMTLFRQYEIVRGQFTQNGVVARRLVDYQNFVYKMYGIQQDEQSLAEKFLKEARKQNQVSPQNSDIERKSSLATSHIIQKYNNETTHLMLLKNLTHQNREILQEKKVLQQKYQDQAELCESLKLQVQNLQDQMQQIQQTYQQEVAKNQQHDVESHLKDMENMQIYDTLQQSVLQKSKLRERNLFLENQKLQRQLELKDRQMDQYRIELQGLINEMNYIKTIRQD